MKFQKGQYEALYEIIKEAAAIVLGGIVIGGLFSQSVSVYFVIFGFFLYIILTLVAIYFKGKGE